MAFRALDFLMRLRLPRPAAHQAEDRVDLRLPGLSLRMERLSNRPVPAELTVVVPRTEFHAHLHTHDGGKATVDLVLNAITLVHSPRHVAETIIPALRTSPGTAAAPGTTHAPAPGPPTRGSGKEDT